MFTLGFEKTALKKTTVRRAFKKVLEGASDRNYGHAHGRTAQRMADAYKKPGKEASGLSHKGRVLYQYRLYNKARKGRAAMKEIKRRSSLRAIIGKGKE